MYWNNIPCPLVVIVGPTAVGKTEISIRLAERIGGEIVSADSCLFYCGMTIGTAKPDAQDMARVRHFLIDVVNPDETWSLALFQREARAVIAGIHGRGKLPLLVGGTGQYVRSVIEGWDLPVQPPDFQLRMILEAWGEAIGAHALHQKLAILDAEAARIIDPNNRRRTIRALEVIFRTGEKFSQQRRQKTSPYSLLMIGLNRSREELYRRIDERIERMIEAGLVEEVRGLLAQGYSSDLPAFSAIGYRQIIEYLEGDLSLEEAISQMKRLTRQFVRRQANWFKPDDPNIHWFQAGENSVDEIERLIRSGTCWKFPGDR